MKKNKGKLGKDAGNDALIKSLKDLIKDDKPIMTKKKIMTPTPRLTKKDIDFNDDIKKAMDDDDDDVSNKKELVMSNTEYQIYRDKGTGTVIIKPEEDLVIKLDKINGTVLDDIDYIVAVILEQKEHLKQEVLERYIEGNPHLEQYLEDIKLFSGMTLVDIDNEIDYDDISKLKEHMFEKYELGLEIFKRQIIKKTIKHSEWQIWKSEVLLYYLDQFLYKEYRVQFKDDMKEKFKDFFEFKPSEKSKYNEFDRIMIHLSDEDNERIKENDTIQIYLNKAYIENSERRKDSTETNPDIVSRSFYDRWKKFMLENRIKIAAGTISTAVISFLMSGAADKAFLLNLVGSSLLQWAGYNKGDGAIIGKDNLDDIVEKGGHKITSEKNENYQGMLAKGNVRKRTIKIGTQKMYKNKRIQSGKFILLLKMCDKWLNEWLENIEIELGHPIPFMKEEEKRELFFNYDYDNEKEKQDLIKNIQEKLNDVTIKKYYIDKLNNWCHSDVRKEYDDIIEIQKFIDSDVDKPDRDLTTEKTNFTPIINSLSIPGSEKDKLRAKVTAVTKETRRGKRNPVAVDGGSDYKSSEIYQKAKKAFLDGNLSREGFKKKKYDIKKEILNRK